MLVALLNYFRTCRKEEGRGAWTNTCCEAIQYEKADRGDLWAETLPQTPKWDFSTAKRDFGTVKQETKTNWQKCVLKCLNQVIQELVVHLEKQNIPLPVGTITIKLTTGGK